MSSALMVVNYKVIFYHEMRLKAEFLFCVQLLRLKISTQILVVQGS